MAFTAESHVVVRSRPVPHLAPTMPSWDDPLSPQAHCPARDDSDSPNAFIVALSAAAITAGAAAFVHFRRQRQRTEPVPRSTSPPSTPSAVSAMARLWLAQDPDPKTCEVLRTQLHIVSTRDSAELRARLAVALDPANRLRFGTAGMRAEVGLGYDRLNVLNVVAVAQGVLAVLRKDGGVNNGIVVGYDARYDSEKFAVAIAAVFDEADVAVRLFPRPVPTPFVAFAAVSMECDAAFCVTASHNPAKDNGIKVFWRDGIQIRSDVAGKVEAAVRENARPWKRYPLERFALSARVVDPMPDVEKPYYAKMTRALRRRTAIENGATPPVVYTACHGVGHEYIDRMFAAFGLPATVPCEEQCKPDPAFPTLPFPNPEEKGALDMAVETARKSGVRLVLANDPDADRLGAAELSYPGGEVRVFTGNDIAILLTDYLSAGREGEDMSKYAVVASTVSSKICASMARKRGFVFREALTGFKWLNKVAVDLEGKTVLLTYEEALGFNVTKNILRDKDGVSAAAVFAEMAGAIFESGSSLSRRLNELLDECGVHLSKNGYFRTSSSSATTTEIFEKARERGLPRTLGKAVVMSVRDLTQGTDTAEPDGKAKLPCDPRSQFVTFRCGRDESTPADDPSLIIHLRGSGTGTLPLKLVCIILSVTVQRGD